MTNLNSLTIHSARQLLQSNEISVQDLLEACYQQIERYNDQFEAFITVIDPPDGEVASLAEPLAGIPLAVKDLFDTAGVRTTAGSKFFADHIPDYDAVAVEKLKQAGALIVGKTNTHEIALGLTGDNPHYGTARNPWDPSRVPGGSSSGSAIAVAADMVLGALGTDTGGSIRVPAALCGVVGFKPTYGRVSTRGVFPLSWNLDHVGPIAKSVEDAAQLLQVIDAYDPLDPAAAQSSTDESFGFQHQRLNGLRIALATGEYVAASDADVLDALAAAAAVLANLGAELQEVDMNWLEAAAVANRTTLQVDGAAFHRERLAEHPDWFGTDVRQRLETGAQTSATDYALARRTQAEIKQRFRQFFEEYDVLILPTTPISAPPIEGLNAIEQAGRLTRFTAPFNLAGLPALSVPCGFTSAGLPLGLQIVARAWADLRVLNVGHAFEQGSAWRHKSPLNA